MEQSNELVIYKFSVFGQSASHVWGNCAMDFYILLLVHVNKQVAESLFYVSIYEYGFNQSFLQRITYLTYEQYLIYLDNEKKIPV